MYTDYTSYEVACEAIKEDPNNLPDVSKLSKEEGEHLINSLKLNRVIKAVNLNPDGTPWRPDYRGNSRNYEMGFGIEATEDKPSGVGFSRSGYDVWASGTFCGSRLVFRDVQRLQFVQEHYKPLLEKVYLFLD